MLSLAWVGFHAAILEILYTVGNVLLGSDEALGSCFPETRASWLGVGGSFGTHANEGDARRKIVSFGISLLYLNTISDGTLLLIKNSFDVLEFFDLCLQLTRGNDRPLGCLALLALKQWESRGAIPISPHQIYFGSR